MFLDKIYCMQVFSSANIELLYIQWKILQMTFPSLRILVRQAMIPPIAWQIH